MKEIKSIVATYDRLKEDDVKMALATVVHVEDSSYRRSGARMLIAADGTWTGGISGGCLEGDTLLKAQKVISTNKPTVVRYDTRDDDPNQIGVGLGCNGLIDVLIAPITEEKNPIEQLRSIMNTRTPVTAITIVSSADASLSAGTFYVNEAPNFLAAAQNDVLNQRRSETVQIETGGGICRAFIEYLPPSIRLLIFGKNYDTVPLARIAREVGWQVTVVANLTKISKELYQAADQIHDSRKGLPIIDGHTACMLMAHDYATDRDHFGSLLHSEACYIGLLGPRKRFDKMLTERESLRDHGDNVFAPVGLDTGATSPEEIAISIIAEIRAHLSDRAGGHLRHRKGSIHQKA